MVAVSATSSIMHTGSGFLSQLNFTEMKKNIFVISTIFLGIVVVALQ